MDDRGDRLSPQASSAIAAAVPHYLPPDALVAFARWWQLESWLRQLAYVELRAAFGQAWLTQVKASAGRMNADARFAHMATSDSENPLAYLDYSQLLALIQDHWELFEPALIERTAWDGRQTELQRVRHRIAHMRRPHTDDVARLEQMLRDLEQGTFLALASYNEQHEPQPPEHSDAVTIGWIAGRHADAKRLVNHARRNYETRMSLTISRRPWAAWTSELDKAKGLLWHLDFYSSGLMMTAPRRFWNDTHIDGIRDLIVHVRATYPGHIGVTFAAVDGAEQIGGAIGTVFDTVLMDRTPTDVNDADSWLLDASDIDYRVLATSGWTVVSRSTVPISNFGSGGSVQRPPRLL